MAYKVFNYLLFFALVFLGVQSVMGGITHLMGDDLPPRVVPPSKLEPE